MGIQVDDELVAFLEDGCAVVVGTCDQGLVPAVTRAWGPRVVRQPLAIEICLGLPSGERTLRNLALNARLAVTWVRPCDYKQVQLKGRMVARVEPDHEDRARIARHREAFARQVEHVGIAYALTPGFWGHDDPATMTKVRFVLDDAFDQTPGPDAGRRL